jgi:siroheme synthase
MGLATAPTIAARLIEAGRAPSTPVLVVQNASLADERRVLTRLVDLPTATAGLDGPVLLLIGEVAALAYTEGADVQPLIETAEWRLA